MLCSLLQSLSIWFFLLSYWYNLDCSFHLTICFLVCESLLYPFSICLWSFVCELFLCSYPQCEQLKKIQRKQQQLQQHTGPGGNGANDGHNGSMGDKTSGSTATGGKLSPYSRIGANSTSVGHLTDSSADSPGFSIGGMTYLTHSPDGKDDLLFVSHYWTDFVTNINVYHSIQLYDENNTSLDQQHVPCLCVHNTICGIMILQWSCRILLFSSRGRHLLQKRTWWYGQWDQFGWIGRCTGWWANNYIIRSRGL